jgi:prevent-host-death family protein
MTAAAFPLRVTSTRSCSRWTRHLRANAPSLVPGERLMRMVTADRCSYIAAKSVDALMALRDVNGLSEVVDQVEREHDRVAITRHGKPAAVVISTDDLASFEENLEGHEPA